jgi:hypothetical protein
MQLAVDAGGDGVLFDCVEVRYVPGAVYAVAVAFGEHRVVGDVAGAAGSRTGFG